MCGIAGLVGPRAYDAGLLTLMMERIAHRGPDGRGTWRDRNVALGHLRLKIIDLSENAAQPMVDPASGNILIFNGEIYNYIELRRQIGDRYRFRTESDTEVLLASYAVWGTACLKYLRGMFAFALWDARSEHMFLARDRYGIKPLYYRQTPDCFMFASEIKSLHQLPGLPDGLNAPRVMEFMCARQLDSTRETMFHGILQVPSAHYTLVGRDGGGPRFVKYWSLPPRGERQFQPQDSIAFLEKFRETVSLHLRSDVPLGALVSGGLDSSSIACLSRDLLGGGTLHTFSSVLETPNEENALIPYVQQRVKGIDHEIRLDGKSFLESLGQVIYHHDEPIADASMYAHHRLCQLAKQSGVTVLLSGNGGDEILGGYPSHVYAFLGSLLKSGAVWSLAQAARQYSMNRNEPCGLLWLRALQEALPVPVRRLHKHLEFWRATRHVDLGVSVRTLPFFYSIAQDPFTANFDNNLFHWTVPPFLHYEDRNSMAHGVEVRVPFLDHEFVEYTLQFSAASMVGGKTKRMLRNAMKGIVPDKVLEQRGKFGFAAPLDVFLSGPETEVLDRYVQLVELVPFIDREKAMQLARAYYRDGTTGRISIFWRTFSIAVWYEMFFVRRWRDSAANCDPWQRRISV